MELVMKKSFKPQSYYCTGNKLWLVQYRTCLGREQARYKRIVKPLSKDIQSTVGNWQDIKLDVLKRPCLWCDCEREFLLLENFTPIYNEQTITKLLWLL